MPRRVVIHAGFHKTGTSTLQQTLRHNRPLLRPYLRSVLRAGLKDAVYAARGFSTWRDPLTLAKFRYRFEAALRPLKGMPKRCLCLSAEELSGHLPGRGDLADYSAAPILATEMAGAVAAVLGDNTDLVFYYSTRDPETWLKSAYWEHVKASSMTLDFDDFAARYRPASELPEIIARIAGALPCRIETASLGDTTTMTAGPATPILDLCDVPAEVQRQLGVTPANPNLGEAVLLELLRANREISDRSARDAAKAAILGAAKEETDDV